MFAAITNMETASQLSQEDIDNLLKPDESFDWADEVEESLAASEAGSSSPASNITHPPEDDLLSLWNIPELSTFDESLLRSRPFTPESAAEVKETFVIDDDGFLWPDLNIPRSRPFTPDSAEEVKENFVIDEDGFLWPSRPPSPSPSPESAEAKDVAEDFVIDEDGFLWPDLADVESDVNDEVITPPVRPETRAYYRPEVFQPRLYTIYEDDESLIEENHKPDTTEVPVSDRRSPPNPTSHTPPPLPLSEESQGPDITVPELDNSHPPPPPPDEAKLPEPKPNIASDEQDKAKEKWRTLKRFVKKSWELIKPMVPEAVLRLPESHPVLTSYLLQTELFQSLDEAAQQVTSLLAYVPRN